VTTSQRHRRSVQASAALLGSLLILLASVPTVPAAAEGTSSPAATSTLVLQPGPANGTDTFLQSGSPRWNFGDNSTLVVGSNNGSLSRSLIWFDLSELPPGAKIVDAIFEGYRVSGTPGRVEVRRATAPWTEGSGGRDWTRIPVTVRETAGVPRVLEPVELDLGFPLGTVLNPETDVHVRAAGADIPSQVYLASYSGGWSVGARVVFGATVGAYASRTYDVVLAINGTAVPAYRTRTWSIGPLWTFGPTGGGGTGATVIDLDGDGHLEVVFGSADGYIHVLDEHGLVKWSTQVSTTRSVPYTPQVADLEGDGALDIVALFNDPGVVRLDRNGNVVWRVTQNLQSLSYATPVLFDANGDGVLDVVSGGRNAAVVALSGVDGSTLQTYPAGDGVYSPGIADLDGDGVGEIVFASDDKLIHAYRRDGTQIWAVHAPGVTWPELPVALADIDGDGLRDVITADEEQSSPLYALRGLDGSVLWSATLPVNSWRDGGITLADLDMDGRSDMIVPLESGHLFVLDATNGSVKWSYQDSAQQPLYPAAADLDKDGNLEIVYFEEGSGGTAAIRVLNRTGSLVWQWNVAANNPGLRTLLQFYMIQPAIVDLDGDGTLEILVPTGSGMQAFGVGGLARDWRTWGYDMNHTHVAFDGDSPDGVAVLESSIGAAQNVLPAGASWVSRDGSTPWVVEGGTFGGVEAVADAADGWMSWNVTALVRDWHEGLYPNVGMFLVESDEASGGLHVFQSSEGPDPLLAPRLRITYEVPTVNPVPRIAGTIPDVSRPEDSAAWSVNLEGFAQDEDTPLAQLAWNITGLDGRIVTVTGMNRPGNHLLTFYPQKDAFGNLRVTYWLTDPEGNSARQSAWINITPVNDPPAFNPPPSLIVRFDEPYTFDYAPYISDVDDPLDGLTLSSDDPVRASVSGFSVTYLYPKSLLDQWVFVGLTVRDGSASVARVVAVKVTDDRPPVLTRSLPDVTMYEGEFRPNVFDLNDYFVDPDNDALYFTEGYTHLTITIHANNTVDILAEAEWWGWETVTFRAEDPQGAIAEDTIVVTVLPIDDPPVIGDVPDLRVRYEAPYSFNLEPYIYDPDTPAELLTVSTTSPYVIVSGQIMTLLYPASLNGTVQNLTIYVADETSTVSKTVRVTVGDDWPPVLRQSLPDSVFMEDEVRLGAYNLSQFFEDPDGSTLYYSSGNVNVFVTIGPSGVVDLSAKRDWFGSERVTFRATDSAGGLAEDLVTITVLPVNDAPYFLPVPDLALNTTAHFLDLSEYLGDVDNGIADLTLSTTSPFATVVGTGLLLRFAADTTADIEVVVSDGQLSNSTTLRVVVTLPKAVAVLPPYLSWAIGAAGAIGAAAFVTYRWRKLEWAFLVTNQGLLVASVSRRDSAALDTDLMTGMLTTIMDFARTSFSDETERNLEGLRLGDENVAIVRGRVAYLAVVYRGRTPGSLLRLMRSLLDLIESRHADALGDIVDTSRLGDIPSLLRRLVNYGWWPFLHFRLSETPSRPSPQA